MKKSVCILLNSLNEFDFKEAINIFLPEDRFDVVVRDEPPDDLNRFDFVFPFNYRSIIKKAAAAGNVIVMHASALPMGRGWAPIYYSFKEGSPEYVVSVIFAIDQVDAGDVIMRARFPMAPEYTASFLRKIDNELFLLLISKLFENWPYARPIGVKQKGVGCYRDRRNPNDSIVDLNKPLAEMLPHLRGVEPSHPAFFIFEGIKYFIEISPEIPPIKPRKIFLEYPALNKVEVWEGWSDS